ncbi:D-alanyl-lipoteichoic acid acyltransferase DltB, MBOAT superfamily [Aromatoleum tolulyticum]|uniref:Probable alginate O-acetylase AlgI n=1 Tax=Aromatoleum tolulyticum TaxID=34027 RepID=A0A1N6V933_9RHOO|nr:MBOAT family O-acyltransferase [Aromatoleum tolulyticum]SIQ74268.1 D-alanyl-lipoteichoic acid acyltransferase DltB, MBOAT superfamily [Aromatoleum tolulyticum]
MIFSSVSFAVFFAAVLATYLLARSPTQRATVLLMASLIFYASWKPAYLILLGASVTANWFVYRGMLATRSRALMITAIAANLTVLGCFKYLALLIESALWLARVAGAEVAVARPAWIDWVLPLGISFYTFHMLSAMIDVYRGDCTRSISFRHWCLFVSFFPQLIAGPIVRVHELVAQLEDLQPVSWRNLKIGAFIFAGGLIKKALLADNLAPLVDALFAQPAQLDFLLAWLATLGFGMEIYLDFSGYSEMALGLACMFGVTLPLNFRFPYMARSATEFWHRWHMSLSRWLRDYLYISIGGNRSGRFGSYRNLMITMLLGGLWHGANWTFVFWGFLHGTLLIGHRLLNAALRVAGIAEGALLDRALSWLGWPLTFVAIHFTWVFFRAPNFTDAWTVCAAMLGLAEPAALVSVRLYEVVGVLMTVVLVLIEPRIVAVFERRGVDWWWRVPFPLRGVAYASLVLAIVVFGGPTQKFIYFDF